MPHLPGGGRPRRPDCAVLQVNCPVSFWLSLAIAVVLCCNKLKQVMVTGMDTCMRTAPSSFHSRNANASQVDRTAVHMSLDCSPPVSRLCMIWPCDREINFALLCCCIMQTFFVNVYFEVHGIIPGAAPGPGTLMHAIPMCMVPGTW